VLNKASEANFHLKINLTMKRMMFGVIRKSKALTGRAALMAVSATVLLGGINAKADYSSTVLADAPTGYWRLGEIPQYATAVNGGSGGAALNGQYQFGVLHQAGGAIVGDGDKSASFDGLARVEVPFSAALNPSGAFTVECWTILTNGVTTNTYRSPVTSRDTSPGSRGYSLYADNLNRWSFWTALGGSGTYATANGPVAQTNVWTHLVGTRDALGTNRLYVNGVLVATVSAPTFFPNTNTARGLRIGAGGTENAAGTFYWPGRVDEVAVYGAQLSDAQVAAHYANGTNASRSQPYNQLVLNDGAVGYWRLGEVAPAVMATNLGTAGSVANGIFMGSPATVYPGTVGALSDGSSAITFSNATTAPFGAKIDVPYAAALNPSTFAVECWAYVPSLYRDYQCLVSTRNTTGTGTERGYILYARNNGKLEFWTGREAGWNTVASTNTFPLNTWFHVVGVYDGSYMFLYLNNELVGYQKVVVPYVPNFANPFRIGASESENARGNFFLNGSVDEVATYGGPLSQVAVSNHYAAAFSVPPTTITAPYFVQDPQNVTNQIGGSVTLTGIAFGGVPIQYQWTKDGVNLPGQTGYTLNLANLSTGDSGVYQLNAFNGVGSIGSAQAYVQVLPPGGPVLLTDLPGTLTVYAGSSPKLEVKVSGSAPFTFNWKSNGVQIATTSTSSLVLGNITPSFNGSQYQVQVVNAYGNTNSSVAMLQVTVPDPASSTAAVLAQHPISFWRLGEDASTVTAFDYWGGNNGQYTNATQHYLPGALGLDDDGATQLYGSGSRVIVPNGAPYDFSGNSEFTFSIWARPDRLTGFQRVFSNRRYLNSTAPGGYGFGFNNANEIRFTAFAILDVTASVNLSVGQWYHLAASYVNHTMVIYLNGAPVKTNTLSNIIPGGEPLYMGGSPDGTEEAFAGAIDEAAVFGTALTPAQIKSLYDSRNGSQPNIVQQPTSISVFAGKTASFSVQAAGTAPLSYQWKSNNVALVGQTNATLFLGNAQLAWSGAQFSVTISNGAGSTNSDPATLTVIAPSGYAAAVLQDQPVAFWRLGESSGPMVSDWVGGHNGTADAGVGFGVPGALSGSSDTAATFSASKIDVPFSTDLNQGVFSIEFWARVNGGSGTYRSPLTSRDTGGRGYIFYAGSDDHWQFWTGPGGNPWQTIPGPAVVDGEWTHLVGTFDGVTKTFYVNGQLVGSAQVPFNLNTARPFRIGAGVTEGPGDLFFPGDIDEVAYYNTVLSADRVANHFGLGAYGTTTPPFFIQQPTSQTILVGQNVALSATVGGSPSLSYQWKKDGANVPGGTGLTLNISNAQYSDNGNYTLTAANGLGSVTSTAVKLSVLPSPQFANVTNGLVLHLGFDGNYQDTSGHNNNGSAAGTPTFVTGKVGGQALHYSTDAGTASYNYVSLGAPADLQFGPDLNFSVAYWVRLSGTPNNIPILGNVYGGFNTWGYCFAPSTNGAWSYSLANAFTTIPVTGSAGSIGDGNWHHVLHTFDRTGNGVTYLDGVTVDQRSIVNAGDLNNGQPSNIGQDSSGAYVPPFQSGAADVDDIGVWNRVLTPYEAQSIYLVGKNYSRSFDTYGPVAMQVGSAAGQMEIIWQAGTLLEANELTGPWTPVAGASAPYYKVVPSAAKKFYRVSQ
jgi:Concanavalin A-like lectin/glucanases superfamily/Immunoglobulin I-set domain